MALANGTGFIRRAALLCHPRSGSSRND